ncbi:MAG: hypothetical protein LBQ44_06290 [Treponema sp.]|jgi:uncharacterized membrane protein YcgQ (UPF0703/DUF1980 family)|nr:hypothetical protein [Treponema sp.]
MKKYRLFLSFACFALCGLFLGGCKKLPVLSTPKNAAGTRSVALQERDAPAPPSQVVEITEKMFIAQTNDVYLNPEDYLGKTIKLEGLFKTETYTDLSKTYCFVLRFGPGCCGNDGSAGFEVIWSGDHPYPKEDAWVEAEGVLSTYEEEGYPYLYLALSQLNVKNKRGAEFVSQ